MSAKLDDGHVPAYCANGHAVGLWGGPLYAKRDTLVLFWGLPLTCRKCGAYCYGGHR